MFQKSDEFCPIKGFNQFIFPSSISKLVGLLIGEREHHNSVILVRKGYFCKGYNIDHFFGFDRGIQGQEWLEEVDEFVSD